MKKIVLAASALVASVSVPAAAQLADGSFEAQGAASIGNTSYCYLNNTCVLGAWTGTGNTGFVGANNADWPGAPGTDGSYHAFIQDTGALFQTFTAAATGTFALNYLDAGRSRPGYDGLHFYVPRFNGQVLEQGMTDGSTPAGQTFTEHTTRAFRLVEGQSYTIGFTGDFYDGADATSFIDRVSLISAVPEPATWALMIIGFGATGGAMRRRSKVRVSASLA